MKVSHRTWMSFVAGAAATASIWTLVSPKPEELAETPRTRTDDRQPAWGPDSLRAALHALDSAKTDEERIEATIRLGRIPVSEVEAALESLPDPGPNSLSLAYRTLLIRWGAGDGPAAATWAWNKFRSTGHWQSAFQEIGSSWAWHDPAGLQRWALASPMPSYGDPVESHRIAAASRVPVLDMEIGRIVEWLFPEKPALAIELKRKRGGMSSDDSKLAKSLGHPAKVQEALSAWDDLEKLDTEKVTSDQLIAWTLLQRWQELDPDGFSRSPHAALLAGIDMSPLLRNASALMATPPEGRGAEAGRLLESLPERQRVVQRHALAREWAAESPAAAAAWMAGQPEHRQNEAAIASGGFPVRPAETMAWIATLPEPARTGALVAGHEAWSNWADGGKPDMSGWTDAQVEAWQDLEALAE